MTTTVDVALDVVQFDILAAIARHDGKEVREVVEEAIARYVDSLRSKSPAELEAYISAMRMRPEGIG